MCSCCRDARLGSRAALCDDIRSTMRIYIRLAARLLIALLIVLLIVYFVTSTFVDPRNAGEKIRDRIKANQH